MEKISISEILALVAAVGVVYLYWNNKKTRREAREALIKERAAEANEIHRQAEELKNGLVKKKEEYENAKLKVFAVHDGADDSGKPDGEG